MIKLPTIVSCLIICSAISVCVKGKSISAESWMFDIKEYIYGHTLLDITVPGTHDSGMYYYQNNVGPEESPLLNEMIRVAADVNIPVYPFIGNWALAQNTTFYQQLMGGVRYLDLRACLWNNKWYTEHFLIGVPTQNLLDDISRFMANHTGEVIILEVGDLSGSTNDNRTTLLDMIQNTLKPYLAFPQPHGLRSLTIGQMVKTNQRIVVLFPQTRGFPDYATFLWDLDTFKEGSYADKDVLKEMEAWNVAKISTLGGHGKFFELSWTLTTQVPQISQSVDPLFHPRTLKELAHIADSALDDFVYSHKNYKLGNMILVDFWNDSRVVDLVIYLNMRMCNDKHEFIAVRPDGQYCRQYYQNGNCTNIDYLQWMSINCPLSCGYC